MTNRYFCEKPIVAERALLSGAEAHHLIHVMRVKPADRVVLFDGSGAEFPAIVERIDRAEVWVIILSREEADRELPARLTLGVALPKGDRQKWLVEKAVELGVARLVPLITIRSVAQPGGQVLNRLRRTVIEASKQCGRNRLMEIAKPQRWDEFLADSIHEPRRLLAHIKHSTEQFAHPSTIDLSDPLRRACQHNDKNESEADSGILLAVGPEGGLTEDEAAQAVAAGWQIVCLGPRVLRVETAALMLVALVSVHKSGTGSFFSPDTVRGMIEG
jgi:16S rRNA (uracil1498-N3)-methyltransferase